MLGFRLKNDWAYYALFQYFWLLVILPKAVQLVCLGALLCLIFFRAGKEKPLDTFSLLQLCFVLIYGVSILINTITADHEAVRIFAAVNTWAVTLVAVLLYHLYRHIEIDLHRLGRYCFINLCILAALWLVFEISNGALYPLLGKTLSGDDWVNGQYTPRFFGYLDYANLVVFSVLFFYPFAMRFLQKHRLIALVMTVVLFLTVNATNSRTGLVLYLLVFLAYFLFEMQKSFFRVYQRMKTVLFFIAGLVVLAVLVIALQQILEILNEFINMREGSNNMRLYIYTESLRTMFENSPLIGIGIKDMVGDYPLGSHSTYIGVLYKAGILGGAIYIVSMLYMLIRQIFRRDRDRHSATLKICIAAALILMVLEDIDGANWCVCIFYTLLGLLEGPYGNVKEMKQRKLL